MTSLSLGDPAVTTPPPVLARRRTTRTARLGDLHVGGVPSVLVG
ncbi:hypothetical protein [Brachybacterium sp. EE-P12]|nr:hypothetical protein [Brachybacterium sp. EE-P12]